MEPRCLLNCHHQARVRCHRFPQMKGTTRQAPAFFCVVEGKSNVALSLNVLFPLPGLMCHQQHPTTFPSDDWVEFANIFRGQRFSGEAILSPPGGDIVTGAPAWQIIYCSPVNKGHYVIPQLQLKFNIRKPRYVPESPKRGDRSIELQQIQLQRNAVT